MKITLASHDENGVSGVIKDQSGQMLRVTLSENNETNTAMISVITQGSLLAYAEFAISPDNSIPDLVLSGLSMSALNNIFWPKAEITPARLRAIEAVKAFSYLMIEKVSKKALEESHHIRNCQGCREKIEQALALSAVASGVH